MDIAQVNAGSLQNPGGLISPQSAETQIAQPSTGNLVRGDTVTISPEAKVLANQADQSRDAAPTPPTGTLQTDLSGNPAAGGLGNKGIQFPEPGGVSFGTIG